MIAVARQTRKNSIAELVGVCTPEQGLFDTMFNIISQAKRFGKGEDMGLTRSTWCGRTDHVEHAKSLEHQRWIHNCLIRTILGEARGL